MKGLLKIILILALIGGGAYFFLGRSNTSGLKIPSLSFSGSPMASTTAGQLQLLGQKGKTAAIQAAAAVGSLAEKAVQAVKQAIYSSFKNTVDQKVESVGKSLGVNIGFGSDSGSGPISFSIKAGTKAYFTVKNNFTDAAIDYSVDWQDGNSNSGQVIKDSSVIVSHIWEKAGDYNINFEITHLQQKQNYQILISIFS